LHQAAFLQYRLPAVACAPPLLLRLAVRGAPRAVMLEAQLAAAHNLPGALQGLVLDLDAPAALGELAKARPCATRYQALLLRSCRRGFGGRGLGLLEARPAAMAAPAGCRQRAVLHQAARSSPDVGVSRASVCLRPARVWRCRVVTQGWVGRARAQASPRASWAPEQRRLRWRLPELAPGGCAIARAVFRHDGSIAAPAMAAAARGAAAAASFRGPPGGGTLSGVALESCEVTAADAGGGGAQLCAGAGSFQGRVTAQPAQGWPQALLVPIPSHCRAALALQRV